MATLSTGLRAGRWRALVLHGAAAVVLLLVGAGGALPFASVDVRPADRRELTLSAGVRTPSPTPEPDKSLSPATRAPDRDKAPSPAIAIPVPHKTSSPATATPELTLPPATANPPTPRPSAPSPTPPAATSPPRQASGTRDTAAESSLFADLNQRRAGQGLPPLRRASCADGVAEAWSRQMMERGRLSHNPSYESQIAAACGPWSAVAENVSFGPSAASVSESLWRSSSHRANILGDFTQVGVGAHRGSDGSVWATFNFYRP